MILKRDRTTQLKLFNYENLNEPKSATNQLNKKKSYHDNNKRKNLFFLGDD